MKLPRAAETLIESAGDFRYDVDESNEGTFQYRYDDDSERIFENVPVVSLSFEIASDVYAVVAWIENPVSKRYVVTKLGPTVIRRMRDDEFPDAVTRELNRHLGGDFYTFRLGSLAQLRRLFAADDPAETVRSW